MLLDEVQNKLEKFDEHVFYGVVDDRMREMLWNYIVFNRTRLKSSANKTGYGDYFDVHIVRENFIPEGLDTDIIAKVLEIDGVRLCSDDGVYNYVRKNNTGNVVEMLTLSFVRARK